MTTVVRPFTFWTASSSAVAPIACHSRDAIVVHDLLMWSPLSRPQRIVETTGCTRMCLAPNIMYQENANSARHFWIDFCAANDYIWCGRPVKSSGNGFWFSLSNVIQRLRIGFLLVGKEFVTLSRQAVSRRGAIIGSRHDWKSCALARGLRVQVPPSPLVTSVAIYWLE